MVIYPKLAKELVQMLAEDQTEKRKLGQIFFDTNKSVALNAEQVASIGNSGIKAKRVLEILHEVEEPSLTKIGAEAAQAMSVLALHASLTGMKHVLAAFNACYKRQPKNTYFQAIPSLTDCILVLEHKSQQFGTQWLWDNNKEPFLPPVQDFKNVNKRRKQYGVEPLHWPKSLAIPDSRQPWLKRPLSELIMREPTDEEYNEYAKIFTISNLE